MVPPQNSSVLPDDVKTFIRSTIKSIWALELLLYLRAHGDRSWDVKVLSRELRASEPVVRGSLGLFRAAGLVDEAADGTVRYAPAAAHLDPLVRQIAEIYGTFPLAISNEIYAPESRIQHFADAFRLTKKE